MAIIEREPIDPAETAVGEPPDHPTLIPASRYTDPAFFALEQERLWPSVWQIACTVDHVAEPGDCFELPRAGRYSVLIVRGDDGELRAFQNVVPPPGQLAVPGRGDRADRAALPVPPVGLGPARPAPRGAVAASGFGALAQRRLPALRRCRSTRGAARVRQPRPRRACRCVDCLEGVPADTAWARLDEFRCVATTARRCRCNWKVVADGFCETYHVQGLHREMLGSIDDVNAPAAPLGAPRRVVPALRRAEPAPRPRRRRPGGVGLVHRDPGRPHGPGLRERRARCRRCPRARRCAT